MDQANKELLSEKRWALLDVEFIRISSTYRCIRKLYILHDNGFADMEMEFYPCTRYHNLERKYQSSFRYCKQHIHKLSYNPKFYSPECLLTLPILSKFIIRNDIELILYKGGTIEKDMCEALDMPSLNIECFEELVKAHSHDPKFEVNLYYDQLINFIL